MTEKQYNLRAGYYDEYTGICGGNDENFTTNEVCDKLNSLVDENEQLKKELTKLKEWEKYVGDIKREELDAVFKMSIYEIAEGFEYYKKRIKELENEVKE